MKKLTCKFCREKRDRNEFKFYKDGSFNQKCKSCSENPVKKGKPFSGKVCICCNKRKNSQTEFGKTKKGTVQTKCLECMVKVVKVFMRTCICCNKTKERNENFKRYVSRIYSKKCMDCTEIAKTKVLKVKEVKVNPITYEAKQLEKLSDREALNRVKEQEKKYKFERVIREGLNYKGAIILKKV